MKPEIIQITQDLRLLEFKVQAVGVATSVWRLESYARELGWMKIATIQNEELEALRKALNAKHLAEQDKGGREI